MLALCLASMAHAAPRAPAGLCERVARLETTHELAKILLPLTPAGELVGDPDPEVTVERFERQIDVNNDGRPDRVTLLRSRPAGGAKFEVRDSRGEVLTFEYAAQEPDAGTRPAFDPGDTADVGFIVSGGRTYVVHWKYGRYPVREASWLSAVVVVDSGNRVHPVCGFKARRERSSHLRPGAAPVCAAVLGRQVVPVPFDEPVAFPARALEAMENMPVGSAAHVDIDNDGRSDYVAIAENVIQVSHGCGYRALAKLEPRSGWRSDSSAAALRDAGSCAGEHLRPFVFDGATYIERRFADRFPRDFHDVVKIENGALVEICRFEVRRHFEVASEYEIFSGRSEDWLWLDPHRHDPAELWRRALAMNEHRFLDPLWNHEVEFRRQLTEPTEAIRYLASAVEAGREDFVDWLLAHGVDINLRVDGVPFHDRTALEVALAADEPSRMPAWLIRRGADPSPAVGDIVGFAEEHPGPGHRLMIAALRRLGYLPEEFFNHAREVHPALLESLVDVGVPARVTRIAWHAGRPVETGWWRPEDFADDSAEVRRAVRTLDQRRPVLAPVVDASASYSAGNQRWMMAGMVRDAREGEALLMLATATCVLYLSTDCGPARLVDRARTWLRTLPSCEAGLRERYGDDACRLVEEGRRRQQSGSSLSWQHRDRGETRGEDTWVGFLTSQQARRWPDSEAGRGGPVR